VGIQIQLCFLGIPLVLLGLWILLHMRAQDRRAVERHDALLQLLRGVTPGTARRPEAAMATGPESSRSSFLGAATHAQIAARLCPDGPRPAAEIARVLGYATEVADLPMGAPVLLVRETILYRDDERAERSILEGVAAVALQAHGLAVDPAAVEALAGRLSRPAAVRRAWSP